MHFIYLDPPGTGSASLQFGHTQRCSLCLAASLSTKGCRGVLLPDSPRAPGTITQAAFTPMRTAGDVNRASNAHRGSQGSTLCGTEICIFYSQQCYCSPLFFWGTAASTFQVIKWIKPILLILPLSQLFCDQGVFRNHTHMSPDRHLCLKAHPV